MWYYVPHCNKVGNKEIKLQVTIFIITQYFRIKKNNEIHRIQYDTTSARPQGISPAITCLKMIIIPQTYYQNLT